MVLCSSVVTNVVMSAQWCSVRPVHMRATHDTIRVLHAGQGAAAIARSQGLTQPSPEHHAHSSRNPPTVGSDLSGCISLGPAGRRPAWPPGGSPLLRRSVAAPPTTALCSCQGRFALANEEPALASSSGAALTTCTAWFGHARAAMLAASGGKVRGGWGTEKGRCSSKSEGAIANLTRVGRFTGPSCSCAPKTLQGEEQAESETPPLGVRSSLFDLQTA